MKFRTDYVTNSSSSSFILARKPGFNEKQKEAIIRYLEECLLGKCILTPESTEEEIQKVFEKEWEFEDEYTQESVREALKSGKSIYNGRVSFEDDMAECGYAGIFKNIWKLLEQTGNGDFAAIDSDLSY